MSQAKSYFDKHADHPSYAQDPEYYEPIIRNLKNFKPQKKLKILDLGCGSGSFLKGMIDSGINGNFFGSDISFTMLKTAKNNLAGKNVNLFVANLFNLPLKNQVKFDLINLDCVFHHLITKSRSGSFALSKKAIEKLVKMVSKNGSIFIEEVTYESYFIPTFTASIVFYAFKIINFLNLDFSKISNEIILGLEVNFFCKKQLEKFLSQYGRIYEIRHKTWKPRGLRKIFLLKKEGRIAYVLKPNKKNEPNY